MFKPCLVSCGRLSQGAFRTNVKLNLCVKQNHFYAKFYALQSLRIIKPREIVLGDHSLVMFASQQLSYFVNNASLYVWDLADKN